MSDFFKPEKIQRIIIKISGEFLAGSKEIGYDNAILEQITDDLIALKKLGLSIGIVLGGGNFFRGGKEEDKGFDRITGDNVGMLVTVQNSLILADYLNRKNYHCEVFSALEMDKICSFYTPYNVENALSSGKICFLAGGTGNPYFTTDTAAVLRAIELNANLVVKGTKVDGVYSSDPMIDKDAEYYSEISYDEIIAKRLNVMDMTAFSLARDYHIPMKIFNITKPGNLKNAILHKNVGTFIY
ncbi:MAG: UMP kinase [Candidatus Cloacimonetes bacterium]|nr:UMP kinase [Candidatus Cloacimonadota bacterium]